jgi:hypothetical protein
MRTLLLAGIIVGVSAQPPPNEPLPIGSVDAVNALLERVIPGSSAHFSLSLVGSCPGATSPNCYTLSDRSTSVDGSTVVTVDVAGTSASSLTAGIGEYFRESLNLTFGWPRGGGNFIASPSTWPQIGSPVTKSRVVPYSYIMNVCTHSYSLWTYTWPEWEAFIDWMALSGVNLYLAMTGQEEVQYKVFQSFGLNDTTIRTWFNGPALLTWSRGQNEYGNDIAGPLPRSFMKAQWDLQRQILARTRPLGMIGQLPAFQGNVPAALKALRQDSNMTIQGDTAWMDSLDPLYGEIADAWMKQLLTDFGTDHWYQLDGYFDGGTAPWKGREASASPPHSRIESHMPLSPLSDPPACTWSQLLNNSYLAGCVENCKGFSTVSTAQAACIADATCGGITLSQGTWQLRSDAVPQQSPVGEQSYAIINDLECRGSIKPDPMWIKRGAAAYAGLSRTDPDAIWSFQGWAIIDWDNTAQAQSFGGFVAAVPQGKFVIIDMSVDGTGEWQKWDNASFFGAPFIWTTLHDFGGTDGLKGDLARINRIPFDGLLPTANSTVWGTGYTPEGIDQNPVSNSASCDR